MDNATRQYAIRKINSFAKTHYNLKCAPDLWKSDVDIVSAAIISNSANFNYCTTDPKYTRELLMLACQYDYDLHVLPSALAHFMDDESFILSVIKNGGTTTHSFQQTALSSSSFYTIHLASDRLQKSLPFITAALDLGFINIGRCPYPNDKAFILNHIRRTPSFRIEQIGEQLLDDEEVALALMDSKYYLGGGVFYYISERMRDTKTVVMRAIMTQQLKGCSAEISTRLKNDADVAEELIRNGLAEYLGSSIIRNHDFIYSQLAYCGDYLAHFPLAQTNADMVSLAILDSPNAIKRARLSVLFANPQLLVVALLGSASAVVPDVLKIRGYSVASLIVCLRLGTKH